jgi:branched-chain amino acid aminotransferase/4-amino-4-deoxychorismate lyase
MIPFDDRGLTLGDGLFETLLAENGVLRDVDAHLQRLTAGCAVMGLPAPDRALAGRLMIQALETAGLARDRAAVRLTLTAGSGGRGLDRPSKIETRLFATASAYVRPAGPVTLATSAIRRNADSPVSRLKTLAYLDNVLARRAACMAGAEEALMLNTRGEIACASAANVFWISQGRIFTPSLDCGVLAGVLRRSVIEVAASQGVAVVETVAPVERLRDAEAIFLTNSLAGMREVAHWDGRAFEPSRLVEKLAALID